MSVSEIQKYPKVGIFLLVISGEGKWLLDKRDKKTSLPFKELSGGEGWEETVELLKQELQLKTEKATLAGIGSGMGPEGESWVYCAFKIRNIREFSLPGYQWEDPNKAQDINVLSLEIKNACLASWPELWVH